MRRAPAAVLTLVCLVAMATLGCASSGSGRRSDGYYGGGSIHYNSFPRGYRWAGNAGGYW